MCVYVRVCRCMRVHVCCVRVCVYACVPVRACAVCVCVCVRISMYYKTCHNHVMYCYSCHTPWYPSPLLINALIFAFLPDKCQQAYMCNSLSDHLTKGVTASVR